MAEVNLASDLFYFIESVVTCSVCKRFYKNPLVLPVCFHTFCCECIVKSRIESSHLTETSEVKCPGCSQISVLPLAKSFTKNYIAEKLLEVVAFIRTIDHENIQRESFVDFIRRLRDATECPICCELFVEPRMLPCIHTFCASCLKGSATKNVWNPTACPLCRQQFEMPATDFSSLPSNDILDRLLYKMSQPEVQQLVTAALDPDCVPESQKEVNGVAVLGDAIYILYSKLKLVRVYQTSHPYSLLATIKLDSEMIPTDLASCEQDSCLFITDVSGMGSVWRVHVRERLFVVQPVVKIDNCNNPNEVPIFKAELLNLQSQSSDKVFGANVAESDSIKQSNHSPTDLLSRFINATRNRTPIGSNSADQEEVRTASVTGSSQDLVMKTESVILEECPEVVQRVFEAIGLRKSNDGVFRPTIAVQHHVELWLRRVKAIGVSVGPNRELVLISESGELHVYNTANKELLGRYVLPEDVHRPRHAVIHGKSGNFIVSHSARDGSIHRVSELLLDSSTGHLSVLRSYGSTPGQRVGHLHWPRHLASDEDGSIFVADCSNNRVIMLDEQLGLKRVILANRESVELPWRLALMPALGLLIVGSVTGNVQIYSISHKSKRSQ